MAPEIKNPDNQFNTPFTEKGINFKKIAQNPQEIGVNNKTLEKLQDPNGLFCQLCKKMVSSTHNHPIA